MRNFLSDDDKRIFSFVPQDLRSSLVVFLVAVPLCLGIALASEAPIMSGIIAGVVGGIVIGTLGGSQLGVSGPAAGLVAVLLDAKTELGSFEAILLAVVLAGMMQVLLGIAKAGVIAYYFPTSVIKGMLAAIGIIIGLKQIPHGFGYDKDYEGDINFDQQDGHNTLSELGYMLSAIQPGALTIMLVGLGLLVIWDLPRLRKLALFRIVPGPLAVVVLGVVLQLVFEGFVPSMALSKEHLVQIDHSDKAAWFSFPDFGLIGESGIWVTALVIAGVASVETLLSAEATDKLDPEKRLTPMNRELWAQGVGNMVSGLLGGLPITQVIVRSSANVQSGARTRLSAILHGIFIMIAVVLLPEALNHIPYAALAAVLLMVGYKLAKPTLFVSMWKKGLVQFLPFLVTVIAILRTDLLVGIGIGMSIGIFAILYSNFKVPYFFHIKKNDTGRTEIRMVLSEVVSFLNKGNILTTLRMMPPGSTVLIDASRAVSIDPDVEELIEDFQENATLHDIEVIYIKRSETAAQPFASQRSILQQLQEHEAMDAVGAEVASEAAQPK